MRRLNLDQKREEYLLRKYEDCKEYKSFLEKQERENCCANCGRELVNGFRKNTIAVIKKVKPVSNDYNSLHSYSRYKMRICVECDTRDEGEEEDIKPITITMKQDTFSIPNKFHNGWKYRF